VLSSFAELSAKNSQWKFQDSTNSYLLNYDTVPRGEYYSFMLKNIEVKSNDSLIQVIDLDSMKLASYELDISEACIIEDINFDGLADISVFLGTTVNGALPYYGYWLRNVEDGHFKYKDLNVDLLEPSYDHKRKLLHGIWRVGAYHFGCEIYRWSVDTLQLVEKHDMSFGFAYGGPDSIYYSTRILVEEKMIRKSTTVNEIGLFGRHSIQYHLENRNLRRGKFLEN